MLFYLCPLPIPIKKSIYIFIFHILFIFFFLSLVNFPFSRFLNLYSLILYIPFIFFFVSLVNFPLVFIYAPPFSLPNPLYISCILYSINFLFFLPGKLSFSVIFFPHPHHQPPYISCISYSIHCLFFPRKLSIRVFVFMALSQPNPIIFLPVFGGRESYTWLPLGKFYLASSPVLFFFTWLP